MRSKLRAGSKKNIVLEYCKENPGTTSQEATKELGFKSNAEFSRLVNDHRLTRRKFKGPDGIRKFYYWVRADVLAGLCLIPETQYRFEKCLEEGGFKVPPEEPEEQREEQREEKSEPEWQPEPQRRNAYHQFLSDVADQIEQEEEAEKKQEKEEQEKEEQEEEEQEEEIESKSELMVLLDKVSFSIDQRVIDQSLHNSMLQQKVDQLKAEKKVMQSVIQKRKELQDLLEMGIMLQEEIATHKKDLVELKGELNGELDLLED